MAEEKTNDYEVLASSKFAVEFDGLDGLFVKKISGLKTTLITAGSEKPYAVGKDAKTQMQATVTGVENAEITVEFVSSGTPEGKQLKDWYDQCHSESQIGGGTNIKGARKTGSIKLYNQAGEEKARWNIWGAMCKNYKFSAMEAGSDQLATETLQISYEVMLRVETGEAPGARPMGLKAS